MYRGHFCEMPAYTTRYVLSWSIAATSFICYHCHIFSSSIACFSIENRVVPAVKFDT